MKDEKMEPELSLQVREGRVRRALAKYDLILKKTPSRSWLRQIHGAGYMIVNDHNVVVSGAHQREYEDDIDRVEWFAFSYLPNPHAQTAGGRAK
jgi:hypothetical protein